MKTLEQDNERLSSELRDALDALAEAEVVGGADATPFDPELTRDLGGPRPAPPRSACRRGLHRRAPLLRWLR